MGNTELSLDELELDLQNPRFSGLASQREALEKIVQTQGSKLVNLAEDIVANGMSPAHRMLVMKAKGRRASGYVVMDGNRRLAALRVLANPAVLDGMKGLGDVTVKKLKTLAKEFKLDRVQPLDVFVCKDAADARHWIEAIHTGENDGRGVVGWDGIATARYRGQNASLKVLDFLRAAGNLGNEVLSGLERFPITNLDRLLDMPAFLERLGLTIEDGDLVSDLPQAELVRPLKRIVTDLATKKIRVPNIRSRDDRLRYLDSLGTDLPDLSKRTNAAVSLDQLATKAQTKGKAAAKTGSRSSALIERKALIPGPNDAPLKVTDHKLQQMLRELRKLSLDSYPVAVAASFRVFLELSLDHYGTQKAVPGYSTDSKLANKLELVAKALQDSGASRRDLQSFRALASNQHSALNIDRLHGVIHSRYALPTASELRAGWSEVQVAFQKIWS